MPGPEPTEPEVVAGLHVNAASLGISQGDDQLLDVNDNTDQGSQNISVSSCGSAGGQSAASVDRSESQPHLKG